MKGRPEQRTIPVKGRGDASALVLAFTLLALTSCNLPGIPRGTDVFPQVSISSDTETDAIPTPIPPTLTPAPSPTPDVPSGWSSYDNAELGLRVYVPGGWEPLTSGSHQLVLREIDGDGWIEINVIDETSEAMWGVDYHNGLLPDELLGQLLLALGENGEFEAPHPLLTREGRTARFSTGVYDLLSEQLMVAAISLPERAILVVAHGSEGPDLSTDDWLRLLPIYKQIVWSITALHE